MKRTEFLRSLLVLPFLNFFKAPAVSASEKFNSKRVTLIAGPPRPESSNIPGGQGFYLHIQGREGVELLAKLLNVPPQRIWGPENMMGKWEGVNPDVCNIQCWFDPTTNFRSAKLADIIGGWTGEDFINNYI